VPHYEIHTSPQHAIISGAWTSLCPAYRPTDPDDRIRQEVRAAMAIHLEAVYEQGILRPLEPLALVEHQRVHITVDERMHPFRDCLEITFPYRNVLTYI
jgi:predicted DNA-binding antitoxin AbrB/MazE fold protein